MNSVTIVLIGVTFVALLWYRLPLLFRKRTMEERLNEAKEAKGDAGGRVEVMPFRQTMMALISVALIAAALYIILSKNYDDGTQKWAFGVIGSMIGFWFRPGK